MPVLSCQFLVCWFFNQFESMFIFIKLLDRAGSIRYKFSRQSTDVANRSSYLQGAQNSSLLAFFLGNMTEEIMISTLLKIGLPALLMLGVGFAPRLEAQQVRSPQVLSHTVIFLHPSSDPYARDNYRGFNHAPSIVALPDGRLLTAWFSGP